jgi:glycosyltransferase involved in cell wall biosynthesis
MRFSVVICTYNRERFLPGTLDSVAGQTVPADRFEVVLVNNGSTDRTAEIAAGFRDSHPHHSFRYVMEPEQGLSFARNRGIRESAGDIVVFIDDDVRLEPDYLERLDAHYAADAALMANGTRVKVGYEGRRPDWMSRFLEPLVGHHDFGARKRPYPSGKYPVGCSMAFRRETLRHVGDFRTDLGRKGASLGANEEKDLFARIRAAGFPVAYLPDAVLTHRIDDRRLDRSYVKRQAVGVGQGERIRIRDAGVAGWISKCVEEAVKTVGSLILAVGYRLKGHPAKAAMLLTFRYWVWLGLLDRSDA